MNRNEARLTKNSVLKVPTSNPGPVFATRVTLRFVSTDTKNVQHNLDQVYFFRNDFFFSLENENYSEAVIMRLGAFSLSLSLSLSHSKESISASAAAASKQERDLVWNSCGRGSSSSSQPFLHRQLFPPSGLQATGRPFPGNRSAIEVKFSTFSEISSVVKIVSIEWNDSGCFLVDSWMSFSADLSR